MMNYEKIAYDTMDTLNREYYIKNEKQVDISKYIQNCMDKSVYYNPETPLSLHNITHQTKIEIVNETTLQGTYRLYTQYPDANIGALNFASAKNPGGGWLTGSYAQEESLACSSGLVRSLEMFPEFYNYHRTHNDPLYTDRMIYTPRCPILKNDVGEYFSKPYHLDILTSPAPNAGHARKLGYTQKKITEVLQSRIDRILNLFVHHCCDHIVLGAWGCGVFGNDPVIIAQIFADNLLPGKKYDGKFKMVLFSVLDKSIYLENYTAFLDALK